MSTENEERKPESAFVYYAFDENLNIYFATNALFTISATKSFRAIAKTGNVASTEGFVVESNSTLPLLKSARFVRNSSSQEEVTVKT